jgi:hypothetical protein
LLIILNSVTILTNDQVWNTVGPHKKWQVPDENSDQELGEPAAPTWKKKKTSGLKIILNGLRPRGKEVQDDDDDQEQDDQEQDWGLEAPATDESDSDGINPSTDKTSVTSVGK